MLLGARNAIGGGAALPYDKEVQYIHISGANDFVDTGYKYTNTEQNLEFNIDFIPCSQGYAYAYFCGSEYTTPKLYNRSNISVTSDGSGGLVVGSSITYGKEYDLCVNFTKPSSISVDGTVSFSGTRSINTTNGCSLFLGGNGGTIKSANSKVYSFNVIIDNETITNLVPVRKDGLGYFYDTVSKELLGNAGYGGNGFPASCLGPDKT